MKVKGLLPIAILAALSLTGCQLFQKTSESSEQPASSSSASESESSESESSSEQENYGVEIANKQTLLADWYKGSSRDLDITLTPEANPQVELRNGNLVVTSNDPEVVSVSGLGLTGLSVGSAIITVRYHNASDQIYLDILDGSAIGRYGAAHAGDLEDPLTNEDALLVAKHPSYDGEKYYVTGVVESWYHAPTERDDGAVSWFVVPAEEGGEKFEIYQAFKEGAVALTDDDVWIGGTFVVQGSFTVYNKQYETSAGATLISCEGNKPANPPEVLEKTFKQTIDDGKALTDGNSTYDYYKFKGFVLKMSGSNYFLGEKATSSTADTKTMIELYNVDEDAVAKLLYKAQVEITCKIKNYHGQIENLGSFKGANCTVIDEGSEWVEHPEPEVTERSLADFIAGENTKAVAYSVTAKIKAFKNGETKDKYGNMTLTDGTNDLVVYGSTMTATALSWDKFGATYIFTNPQDFLTNETSSALNVGDTITVKMIRADYTDKEGVTTIQGNAVITAVGEPEPPVLTNTIKITKANSGVGTDTLTVAKQVTYSALAGDVTLEWSAGCFDYGNYDEIGVAKTNGYVKVVSLPEGYQISTLVLDFYKYENAKVFATEGGEAIAKTGETASSGLADSKLNTYDINGTSFYIGNASNYAQAFYSIEFTLVEGGVPVEIAQPVGNFAGKITGADDSQIFVVVALGEEAAFVEVGSLGKVTTTYTFNKATGLVTITNETIGTLTAIFDEDTNALTQITLEGVLASLVKNNGEITLAGVAHFWNCDGTTEELRQIFKRRYGDPWSVDTGNEDRINAVEEGIAGGAMKVRAWTGGRYALNFLNDFAEPITVSNVGFWVYNSGTTDVTIKMWGYRAASFGDNFQTGDVTAVAGQWTFCRMGFGEKTIYNFQIADFTKTGTYLVFDNISLF